MMYDKKHEALSKRVGEELYGVCPALVKRKGAASVEWSNWTCSMTGGTCTCIWHVMNYCQAGTWKQLKFAKEYDDRRRSGRSDMQQKVKDAMAVINHEQKPVEDRFHILDLDNE